MSETLNARLTDVRERIRRAEALYHRSPGSVRLIAVSKTHPVAVIRAAAALGQTAFGENYVQEALEKMAELNDSRIEWHFIGHLQRNKTREVAASFDWIHTVDRAQIARRLHDQRPAGMRPLDVCIQVNLQGEATKSGVRPSEAQGLAETVAALPRLRLRGLMMIPALEPDFAAQRRVFHRLRELLEELNRKGFQVDVLSMGMTDDMEAAIAEGATHVRIGTAIFGPRLRRMYVR